MMNPQPYGNMAMELIAEAPVLQHTTHSEAVIQPLKASLEEQTVVNQVPESCLSLELADPQEEGDSEDDELLMLEEQQKKKTRRSKTKVKKKGRAKRNLAYGETQVATAFTFMRKRRQDLTLGAKVKVLEMLEHEPKVPQGKIASMFRVSQSQVSRIMKTKDAIMAQWNRFATPDRKRCRLGKAGVLEQKLVDWYKEAKKEDLPISGPILMEKAKSIGNEMGIEFKPSTGWLGRWKDRNGVTLKTFKDKDGAPSVTKVGNHWRRYMFTKATKEYPLQNVWVVDETVLAYNALPESLTQGNFTGSDKMSVILACNLAGTERRPAVVIGRAQSLGTLTLPAPFHHHPKSFITLEFFSSWLREWDRELRSKRKKIVVLLNKATHHPENLHLFNINMTFFPPGTAAVLQPLRLGIIHTFKALYRHQQLKHFMAKMQANEQMAHTNMFSHSILTPPSVNRCISALDAVFMIYKAWRHVSPETIVKGVVKAGLSKDVDALNVNDHVSAPPGVSQQEFEAFLNSDDGQDLDEHEETEPAQTFNSHPGMITNIIQYPHYSDMFNTPGNKAQQHNPQSESTADDIPSVPSVCEAVFACQVLRRYLQQQGGRLFDEFSELESAVQMDMITETRPDLRNEFQPDPLHDQSSVHSLEAHQVAHEQKLDYIQKVQDELQQQKIKKEMKKATQSPASSQVPHSTLSTSQENRPDLHNHHLGMQRNDVPAQELVRQEMVRQELQQPIQRPDLIRQDVRPEYRQDVPQDRSRTSLVELRTVNMSNFRPAHSDGRADSRNDVKNDSMSVPTDLRSLPTTDHRAAAELHYQGIPTDISQNLRQPDARLENPGIPYYAIPNPLHHYIQPK